MLKLVHWRNSDGSLARRERTDELASAVRAAVSGRQKSAHGLLAALENGLDELGLERLAFVIHSAVVALGEGSEATPAAKWNGCWKVESRSDRVGRAQRAFCASRAAGLVLRLRLPGRG